ncbi:MAG: BlaI/MecI/CopY family transcriptional regulator [Candidatus Bathyarchaeia archaeon]
MHIVFDTSKQGLETLMKPWQVEILRFLWKSGREGVTSKDVWSHLSRVYKISRASVINFLQKLAEDGVLKNEPQTGKGGYRGFYTPKLDEREFGLLVVRTILTRLSEVFPDAAHEAIKEYTTR